MVCPCKNFGGLALTAIRRHGSIHLGLYTGLMMTTVIVLGT